MSIIFHGEGNLDGVTGSYDSLAQDRILTTELSQAEVFTIEGNRHYVEYDAILGSTDVVYIMYQMPALASGYVVALQERLFKSLNGEVDLEILWDSTGYTLGTEIPSFNENRNSSKVGNMKVYNITVAPTSQGTIRERDFLAGSGAGSNSSGDISAGSGTRIYSPDSFFIAKITNIHNADNRIHLSYSWGEIPVQTIVLP